jgi:hypothetical protein
MDPVFASIDMARATRVLRAQTEVRGMQFGENLLREGQNNLMHGESPGERPRTRRAMNAQARRSSLRKELEKSD